MMTVAKMVTHMGRMKMGNLQGIEKHNKRIYKNHSNPDIDISKSYLNYDLVACPNSYKDAYQAEMDKHYTGKKAPRKDAVLCNEWIFSASNDFFENMPEDEEKRFFESCLDFMKERYGHVIYATIHKDETTPHMHLGMIPLTSDGRLSNKSIFTRTELKSLHTALYEHLTQDGFKIDKPQANNSEHLSVMDFKIAKRQEHLDKQNEAIAKNAVVLNNQQTQYKATQLNMDKKKKEILADINKREQALKEREQALKERESSYKKEVEDEYNERKKTLDAFYKRENAKLDERETKLRESEYKLDERKKDIEKRDEEVKRNERNFASKYKKAVHLVKNADEIEKHLNEKIGLYKRLTSTKEDTAILTGLLTSIKQEYGQSVADELYDKAVNGVDATSYVNTQPLDDYKQTKQTHKAKQTDELEF
ncbi:hypothetical protein DJ531_11210 [Sulfolobus sp. A20-N-F6]|nr:hypothetical protein DJ532_14000 [Sulfolobus sp. A20-N-F8]TRM81231.1 hypothetical protein DJ531_11210 [Sulfolobus sp. A20-N-F6]TRM91639.1 hypothetical protein DJ526_06640 [Sulfolobus sp. A20-N-G8]